jgi:hypothetical protein
MLCVPGDGLEFGLPLIASLCGCGAVAVRLDLHVSFFRGIKPPVYGGKRHPDSNTSRQAVCDQLKSTPTRLLICAGSRILEAPVNPLRVSRECWTRFCRAIAHRDDVVEGLAEEPIQVLRVEIVRVHLKACSEYVSGQGVYLGCR